MNADDRQRIRTEIDRVRREQIGTAHNKRYCVDCGITHTDGLTPGCPTCAERLRRRERARGVREQKV